MSGLKWIGMATMAAVLMAAGVAYAQDSNDQPAGASDTSKPKPKPKAKKPKPAADDQAAAKPKKAKVEKLPFVTVTVTNGRSVELVELTAAMVGGNGDSITVAKKLPGGKKSTAKLAHDKACLFDIHGVFDDGQVTDVPGVELCKDKSINLTD